MANIDDPKVLARLDRSSMADVLDSFPEQCLDAQAIGYQSVLPPRYASQARQIVFAGMGGSAIGADILRSYLVREIAIPMGVVRHYTLPAFVSSRSLVIVSSYSGNTEETLSAYRDARTKKAKIIAITSGGSLRDRAREDGFPCITIPPGLQPRCALGYSFFPLLVALGRLGLIGDKRRDIAEAIRTLKVLRDTKIGHAVPMKRNEAKQLAASAQGKFPVIYSGPDHFDSVATRWRGQFAENAKTISSTHVFPEMNHNEIVGWENPAEIVRRFIVIMLSDAHDHPRVSRRMDICRRIIAGQGIKVMTVNSRGASLLARMFSLVYIGDYASFYLALLNGIDPTPIDRITYLKKELARR